VTFLVREGDSFDAFDSSLRVALIFVGGADYVHFKLTAEDTGRSCSLTDGQVGDSLILGHFTVQITCARWCDGYLGYAEFRATWHTKSYNECQHG
jgi:hypothetical protein